MGMCDLIQGLRQFASSANMIVDLSSDLQFFLRLAHMLIRFYFRYFTHNSYTISWIFLLDPQQCRGKFFCSSTGVSFLKNLKSTNEFKFTIYHGSICLFILMVCIFHFLMKSNFILERVLSNQLLVT